MPTCVEVIAAALKELGIRRVFGVPGGETADLIEALTGAGLEFVMTRHEAVAAYMADASGRLTGRPGVCLATLGPGATNLINGVANAYLDRSPVLAITAQVAVADQPYVNHQLIDLEALFSPICKQVYRFTGLGTRDLIRQGYRLARTGPRGPVYFCLPGDVARQEEGEVDRLGDLAAEAGPGRADPERIAALIRAVKGSRRPLVVLGLGLDQARDLSAVGRFIRQNSLPVVATPKAKGAFPAGDPLFIGTSYGMMAADVIDDVFHQADLIIGLDFDPVESDKTWHRDIDLISIGDYSISHEKFAPKLEAVGDIDFTLAQLQAHDLSDHDWTVAEIDQLKLRLGPGPAHLNLPGPGPFDPAEVVLTARRAVGDGAILTTDVGAHKLLVSRLWTSDRPQTFLMSNGFSTMGYGLPSAMAAKLDRPDAEVVCITGDGGLAMVLQDLETAVRLGLGLTVLVMSDNCYSLIEMVQQRRGLTRCGVDFGGIDFAAVAQGFGARGVRLTSMEQLDGIIREAAGGSLPTVVQIPVDNSLYRRWL